MSNLSIYLLIAIEYGQVKECFAVTELAEANRHFETLKQIYGGANVTLASRAVDDVPMLIWNATYGKSAHSADRQWPSTEAMPEQSRMLGY